MPTPEPADLFFRFGMALVLGFFIGFEREREKGVIFAGMRTFAFISLLGALTAFFNDQLDSPWLFIVGFVMVSGYGLTSYFRGFDVGHTGITTEVVFMLTYMIGALVYWDMLLYAAAITVAAIAVLVVKPNLQLIAAKVKREDIYAGLEFAIVTIIALPVLPNQNFGPLNVLNPHEIWLMVVMVSAINLGSYILSQIYGASRGIGLTGVLGGMVSSTVVAFDFARRSRKDERFADLFALAIAIASLGMFFRIVILTLIWNVPLGMALIPPMLVGALVMGAGVLLLWLQVRRQPLEAEYEAEVQQILKEESESEEHAAQEIAGEEGEVADHVTEHSAAGKPDLPQARSPFALKPALQFALFFALVLWLSRFAQVSFGDTGTYLSSTLGGIAGLDAVALSMAKLANTSTAAPTEIFMRSVTFGAAANTLFKGIIATWLGAGTVRRQILPLFVLSALASVIAAFLI